MKMNQDKKRLEKRVRMIIENYNQEEDDFPQTRPSDDEPDEISVLLSLAKDYYVVRTETLKQQLKGDIGKRIHRLKMNYDDDNIYDIIDDVYAIMQHGSPEQDDYNSENAYERKREMQAMDRGY